MSDEDVMNTAIERIMKTYYLMTSRDAAEDAREKLANYISALFNGGEKDEHRLTVYGLTYLRELDGSNDPVKAGFTGM